MYSSNERLYQMPRHINYAILDLNIIINFNKLLQLLINSNVSAHYVEDNIKSVII